MINPLILPKVLPKTGPAFRSVSKVNTGDVVDVLQPGFLVRALDKKGNVVAPPDGGWTENLVTLLDYRIEAAFPTYTSVGEGVDLIRGYTPLPALPDGACIALYGSRIGGYSGFGSDLDVMYDGCTFEEAQNFVSACVRCSCRIDYAKGVVYWHLPSRPYEPVVLVGSGAKLLPATEGLDTTIRELGLKHRNSEGVHIPMWKPGNPLYRIDHRVQAGYAELHGPYQCRSALRFWLNSFPYVGTMGVGSILDRAEKAHLTDAQYQTYLDQHKARMAEYNGRVILERPLDMPDPVYTRGNPNQTRG